MIFVWATMPCIIGGMKHNKSYPTNYFRFDIKYCKHKGVNDVLDYYGNGQNSEIYRDDKWLTLLSEELDPKLR